MNKKRIRTNYKFLEFVGFKGNINFVSKEAFVKGKYFGGLEASESLFKIIIHDDGVEIDEVQGDYTSPETRERFVNSILYNRIIPFRNKMVIPDITFTTTFKDKEIELYLCVDYPTPINKLASLFDESTLTEDQSSKLDSLFSLLEDELNEEKEDVPEEIPEEAVQKDENSISFNHVSILEETFNKLKEQKIEELKSELSKQEKELNKSEYEKSNMDKKIKLINLEIEQLNSRLEQMVPNIQKNGYLFFVSERLNEKIDLDESTSKLIFDKISKVKNINPEAFMNLFKNGEYQIFFGDEELNILDIKDIKLNDDIDNKVSKLRLSMVDDKIIYTGEKTWHELVSFFIKFGFSQNPEFDKKCGSNSYEANNQDN